MIPITPPYAIIAPIHKDSHQITFKSDLKFFESHEIWSNFADISKIYRESGNNAEISNYLKNRLQKAGFKVSIKATNGTICASRGLNKNYNNAVILQSHMDMVGVSSDGNSQKPIQMHEKDGWLYANNRTLGADNGIGMAAMLAVADNPKFEKYPLEMIFTTDEETGMNGAISLTAKDFYGKYLINLDSEKHGELVTGCAGISQFNISEPIKMHSLKSNDFKEIAISLTGTRGGHSADIKPDSLSAIKLLLCKLNNIKDLKLVEFAGGEKFNSIPSNAEVKILVPKNNAEDVANIIQLRFENLKKENSAQNPDLEYSISLKNAEIGTKYIETEFQKKMLKALDLLPVGLFSKFDESESSKTSQNLGVLKIADGKFHIQVMGRSSDDLEQKALQNKTSAILSELFNKTISVSETTPIWQPKQSSPLQTAAIKAYSKISSGEKPTFKVEHGGLESAIFIEKKPDLDEISIGPTIEEPHSVQERVKIDTVTAFYAWLSKIIEILPKK